MRIRLTVIAAMLVCTTGMGINLAAGGDWPGFLGPDRNAKSAETGIARSWPEAGPKVLWTIKMGKGYGGAAILGDEVFVLDRVGNKQDVIRCLDLATGKELWSYAYDASGKFSHDGSRSTPSVDADNVYTIGPLGDLYCISRKTHKPVWNKQLLKDFDGKKPMWVVTQSPLLYKDMIIAAPQGKTAGVAAFNRTDGKLVWKSPSVGGLSYCSPKITTLGGVEQVVMLSNKGPVSGFDVTNGKILWSYEGWSCRIPINSPTPVGDGRIFITGEYGAGSAMIKVAKSGEKFSVTELYKTDVCGAQIHQPILHEGHLYMNSNGNSRKDGMLCLSLDGKVKWKTGGKKFERGGMLFVDGLIFNIEGTNGDLHLIEPGPEGYKEIAKVSLLGGKEIWGPMSLSKGRLIIRDQSQMKCLDVTGK